MDRSPILLMRPIPGQLVSGPFRRGLVAVFSAAATMAPAGALVS